LHAKTRFITALKGPDEEIAKDILNRVAAKVVPIMKKHGMDVMSLEEFPANRQFVGRYNNVYELCWSNVGKKLECRRECRVGFEEFDWGLVTVYVGTTISSISRFSKPQI